MWTIALIAGLTCAAKVCAQDFSGREYNPNGYYDENSITTDSYTTEYSYDTKYSGGSFRRMNVYRRRTSPMPECASQQVCNAVFMRLKYVQPLCRCARSFRDPCSSRMSPDDGHTINLIADRDGVQTQTLVKVCEDVSAVKVCNEPHDWMLLALQNVRTGKAHYLVVCHCPANSFMEGPVLHTNPPYARIPGISVYGMLCVQGSRKSRLHKTEYPPVPWEQIWNLYNVTMRPKPRISKFLMLHRYDLV